jgi:hypothetical protein
LNQKRALQAMSMRVKLWLGSQDLQHLLLPAERVPTGEEEGKTRQMQTTNTSKHKTRAPRSSVLFARALTIAALQSDTAAMASYVQNPASARHLES